MNESGDQEIAKLQATNRELAAHLENLRLKRQADQSRAAYHSHLVESNERMEREIAALEHPGTLPGDEEDEQG
jgi:hypothetical protein